MMILGVEIPNRELVALLVFVAGIVLYASLVTGLSFGE